MCPKDTDWMANSVHPGTGSTCLSNLSVPISVLNVLILTSENGFLRISYSFFRGRQNIFWAMFDTNFVVKMCCKIFENRSANKNFMHKNIFYWYFSIVNKHGREVRIFLENFKSQNNLSKMPKIIKCHERFTWGQNLWIKLTILPELKVYDHGLSPLPMQNPYSKLFLSIKILIIIRFPKCLLHILRQTYKWLNIGKKIFYLTSFKNSK